MPRSEQDAIPFAGSLEGLLRVPLSAASLGRRYPPLGLFLPVPGGRLHAIHRHAAGAAADPAVVLLHGASGNARDLSLDLFDAISRRHRVFSVDRPGHGWSDRPGGADDADPARQGDLILHALGHAGVRRMILVAHSWSGGLAMSLALRHPGRVAGVVLVAAATHPWPNGAISWHHGAAVNRRFGRWFARAASLVGRAFLRSGIEMAFRPDTPPPDFAERTALPLLFRSSQFLANAQDMAGLHAFLCMQAPRYGELAVPVVTIVSDADPVVPMAHGEALAAQSRRVRLVRLRDHGHMLPHVAVQPIVEAVAQLAEAAPGGTGPADADPDTKEPAPLGAG